MTPLGATVFVAFISLFAVFFVVGALLAKKQSKILAEKAAAMRLAMKEKAAADPAWDPAAIERRIQEVFLGFQRAWSDLDAEAMRGLLTDDYYRRAVLEINVLYNQKRRNLMEEVGIFRVDILSFADAASGSGDQVKALISAVARDTLKDIAADKVLMTDSRSFREYWTFRREGGAWKLDLIEQTTADARFIEWSIAEFAKSNGFYYDPDFGWLMMPDRGAIFRATNFGKSDINNHVIGYYRDKIVEFYSYRPDLKNKPKVNYVVAQAILPISYHDILVSKRGWFERCPGGLTEHSLESPDFNKKYLVCAHPEDNVSALELLTPNFMVHVEELPYDLNIEVVDNVLYFYTLDRRCSYDQMLQLLSYAFDEMKK